MSTRTPLGRARGLGSAKSGTGHWWAQRVTALALITKLHYPLSAALSTRCYLLF
jgi:succinate dehydrogenase / fumarate reductase membrane anchor subunit